MDIFRKILGIEDENSDENNKKNKQKRQNEEKWIDEDSFDKKIFSFTNASEMHEQFQKQVEEMLKMFEDGSFEKEDFFKMRPDLKDQLEDLRKNQDMDLDDKSFSTELKSLMDHIVPVKPPMAPIKRNEEEQIMDRIHGTYHEPPQPYVKPRPRRRVIASPHHIPNGVFDGNGARVFGQSIISQTIRRPDGSVETRRTVRDSDGMTRTTITRSENGKTVEELTVMGGDQVKPLEREAPVEHFIVDLDRNLTLTGKGYSVPKNLW